ncbi:hypothetical protein [Gemmatimonas sp.]|uniref:hypothetical protein n=1 Tax=Gemmatimonas sp. TaxID=1962908 RepID=UPI00286AF448|nr:hypothetical protein [Gemmatimonas sp.]
MRHVFEALRLVFEKGRRQRARGRIATPLHQHHLVCICELLQRILERLNKTIVDVVEEDVDGRGIQGRIERDAEGRRARPGEQLLWSSGVRGGRTGGRVGPPRPALTVSIVASSPRCAS